MEKEVVIVYRDEARAEEQRLKHKFVLEVLTKLGFPTSQIPAEMNMQELRNIKRKLKTLNIEILDDCQEGIQILVNNNIIAEWKRPFYILKEDIEQRDRKYRYYLEMHLNTKFYNI